MTKRDDTPSKKPRLDKLGVKPGARVTLLGVEDKTFRSELKQRGTQVGDRVRKDSDLIFLSAKEKGGLKRLKSLQKFLKPNGAIWVVWPKGQPRLKENDVIVAALAVGLVDNKVVSFSETLSALRLVIPLARRPQR